MTTMRSSTVFFQKYLNSEEVRKTSILLLVLGLLFFTFWLANYAWTVITTPYPAEYREGAILLLTDFLIDGINPFALTNHPLMNNNYGFLYNLVILPFAMLLGNTLAVHRALSILFIIASCLLVIYALVRTRTALPFAVVGGGILFGSLLFHVTPLARPDSLGELLFLLTILLPWYRRFEPSGLIASGLTGILAFLAKPYFLLSVVIVSLYVFIFVSKKKGLLYALLVIGSLVLSLYLINIFLECYFLDVIINNMANSSLSQAHLVKQLTLFGKAFLPCFLILFLAVSKHARQGFFEPIRRFREQSFLNITRLDEPLILFPLNYFGFFLVCASVVVVFLLGKNTGAHMTYFFQLITPGLVLVTFQQKEVLYKTAVITVPLALINFYLICFWVLYPNKLSVTQQNEWQKLYRYIAGSTEVLNSPVLVAEMVRLDMLPVDSGQSEYYYFNSQAYDSYPFAPDYEQVHLQGRRYLNSIRMKIQNRRYDYIMVTSNRGFSPFAGRRLIDRFYERVELIHIAMPQTLEYWTIEVNRPKGK